MDDSNVIFDQIIDVKETNFNEKKVTCKAQFLYFTCLFLLITRALLVAAKIYSYLMKYCGKY